MPGHKTGRKMQCCLEGCTKKKYYELNKIKKQKKFYCCEEHKFADQKTSVWIECEVEGCKEGNYYTPSKIKKNNHFCCSPKHAGLIKEGKGEYRTCNFPGCSKKKYYPPYKIRKQKHFYCSNEHSDRARTRPDIVTCSKCGKELPKEDLADSGNYRNGKMRKRSWCYDCEKLRRNKIHQKLRNELHPNYVAVSAKINLLPDTKVKDIPESIIQLKRKQIIIHRLRNHENS